MHNGYVSQLPGWAPTVEVVGGMSPSKMFRRVSSILS